jgi:hypothetical protein
MWYRLQRALLSPLKGKESPLETPTIEQLKAWTQARYGKDPILFECLDLLWTMESHWNYKAKGAKTQAGSGIRNRSSVASREDEICWRRLLRLSPITPK